jgi:hypothetical protein
MARAPTPNRSDRRRLPRRASEIRHGRRTARAFRPAHTKRQTSEAAQRINTAQSELDALVNGLHKSGAAGPRGDDPTSYGYYLAVRLQDGLNQVFNGKLTQPQGKHRTSFAQKRPERSATDEIISRRKPRNINESDRWSAAHNGLVAGSSPAGPTNRSITDRVLILPTVASPHRKRLVLDHSAASTRLQTTAQHSIRLRSLPPQSQYSATCRAKGQKRNLQFSPSIAPTAGNSQQPA